MKRNCLLALLVVIASSLLIACGGGGGNSSPAPAKFSATGTLNVPVCDVPTGRNVCQTPILYTSDAASAKLTALTKDATGATVSIDLSRLTGTGITPISYMAGFGDTTYVLSGTDKAGVEGEIDRVVVTNACALPNNWDGVNCSPPTGNFTGTGGCQVGYGKLSCDTLAAFTTDNILMPRIELQTPAVYNVPAQIKTLSINAGPGTAGVTLYYGMNTFRIYEDTTSPPTLVATRSVQVLCASPYVFRFYYCSN